MQCLYIEFYENQERKVVCVHLILDHIQKTWCSKEFYESFYFSKNLYFIIIPLKNNFELETKKMNDISKHPWPFAKIGMAILKIEI